MSQSLSIVADKQILFAREAFANFADVSLLEGRQIVHDNIKDADVLLVRSVTKVNEDLLKDTSISFVGSATSGIDHIDLNYLDQADIKFAHAPGSNARSVAEYVISGLFALAELHDFALTEKTVGIIGCGQIGSRLAKYLKTLGVTCLLNDPPLAATETDATYVALEEIVKADIITLHVPLTKTGDYPTQQLINKQFLDYLKEDVILINTSRGEVIDESSLIQFKQTKPDATLILDVWCHEPLINLELLEQTLIATPHIAGYSLDGKIKASMMLLEALTTFIDCEPETSDLNGLKNQQNRIELEEDSVQLAVMQSYDIRSDAVALRNLMTLPEQEHADYFDSLRKNYPVRREFTTRKIKSNTMTKQTAYILENLGFKLDI